MRLWRKFCAPLALLLAVAIGSSPARAIVTLSFNDGHDHVYLTASWSAGTDSNVNAASNGKSDYAISTGLQAEYTRRAGWIGVNANVAVNSSRYFTLRSQDFSNPSFGLEFTKQSGRTTGSLTLNAQRSSRADAAVNMRITTWNYSAGLNVAYPVIDRFKLAGQLSYSGTKNVTDKALVDVSSYTAGLTMFYVYSTERDLSAGYRYRYTPTSASTSTTDHDFTVGMTGKLIRGLNGAINVGYQFRVPNGQPSQPTFHGLSASGATSYAITRKIGLTGQISKDYSTSATDSSVDTTAADLGGQYAYNSHWGLSTGAGWGESRFLGQGGRVVLALGPPALFGPNRQDDFVHWNAGLNYSRNEHFKVSLTYNWFRNWSTVSYADFVRSSWNLNVKTSFGSRL